MKKLLNKKGFTLMEMLIVIAIIVILVAIAVPSFSSSLNSAKAATDDANLRAAKSAAAVKAVEDDYKSGEFYFYYDLTTGDVEPLATATTTPTGDYAGACDEHNDNWILVTIENGAVDSVVWSGSVQDCTE